MAQQGHYVFTGEDGPAKPPANDGPSPCGLIGCRCRCGCAGCCCSREAAERRKEEERRQSYNRDGYPDSTETESNAEESFQGPEGPEGHPAAARIDRESPFPWGSDGNHQHIQTRYGGFSYDQNGFQHAEREEFNVVRHSLMPRDPSVVEHRPESPISLINEAATSGQASMASSGFISRRSDSTGLSYSHLGAWEGAVAGAGYHFSGPPLRLTPYAQGHERSAYPAYPEIITDEDIE